MITTDDSKKRSLCQCPSEIFTALKYDWRNELFKTILELPSVDGNIGHKVEPEWWQQWYIQYWLHLGILPSIKSSFSGGNGVDKPESEPCSRSSGLAAKSVRAKENETIAAKTTIKPLYGRWYVFVTEEMTEAKSDMQTNAAENPFRWVLWHYLEKSRPAELLAYAMVIERLKAVKQMTRPAALC